MTLTLRLVNFGQRILVSPFCPKLFVRNVFISGFLRGFFSFDNWSNIKTVKTRKMANVPDCRTTRIFTFHMRIYIKQYIIIYNMINRTMICAITIRFQYIHNLMNSLNCKRWISKIVPIHAMYIYLHYILAFHIGFFIKSSTNFSKYSTWHF